MSNHPDLGIAQYGLISLAAFLAGGINTIAGGGSFITFPGMLAVGYDALIANATSTLSLLPASVSGALGYRSELSSSRHALSRLLPISLVGGILGAILLTHTPEEQFKALVPYLVLGATLVFMAQDRISRWNRERIARNAAEIAPDRNTDIDDADAMDRGHSSPLVWAAGMGFQLAVAIYGGYFGAGAGILMLAAYGFLGFTNIHRMNGLKNLNGLCINGVAALLFIKDGLIDWRGAGVMSVSALLGGLAGVRAARKLGQKTVRAVVILIGLSLTVALFWKR